MRNIHVAIDYLPLSIALFSIVFGSVVAIRFRIPSLIIFLLIGAIIGTYHLIGQTAPISFLGELGSILLLFAIGTEFSIDRLLHTAFKKSSIIAVVEITIAISVLYVALSSSLPFGSALLLALALSITSTGTTFKLLKDLKLVKKFDMMLIVNVSVIEDLIAVFLFSLISSVTLDHSHALQPIAISFAASIILFVVAYYAFNRIFSRVMSKYVRSSEDLLTYSLAILLLFVYLAGSLGLSTAFGAYLAGSIVSGWKGTAAHIERDIKKFSYIFVSFFFLTVGLNVNLNVIDFVLLATVLPVVIMAKAVGIYLGGYAATRDAKKSFYTSAGMLSVGELSLVIVNAAVGSNILPDSYLGLTSFIVFFSTIVSFVIMVKVDKVYGFVYELAHAIGFGVS